jgi:hypothetical protein
MKRPTPNEATSKTCAFMIIISLIITILMQGVYYYQNMLPYIVFITILIVCAIISSTSFIIFLYYKLILGAKSSPSPLVTSDMLKIFVLAVMVFFSVSIPLNIIIKG